MAEDAEYTKVVRDTLVQWMSNGCQYHVSRWVPEDHHPLPPFYARQLADAGRKALSALDSKRRCGEARIALQKAQDELAAAEQQARFHYAAAEEHLAQLGVSMEDVG